MPLDRTITSTSVRKWAFEMLPELCELLSNEKSMEISKTDALSIAVREALEARKRPTSPAAELAKMRKANAE